MTGCNQNRALTIKEETYGSPGSRDYQPSWEKTDHLPFKNDKKVFKAFQIDFEWFFFVRNIT